MPSRHRTISLLASLLLTTSIAGGCGPAGSSPSSGPPTAAPTGAPSASAPGSPAPTSAAFLSMEVVPAQAVGFALPGQRFVFLVRPAGAPADGPVQLTATAAGATVAIQPASVQPGAVAEVTVVPGEVTGDEVPLEVEITARRGAATCTERHTITVQPGTDELRSEADTHLAPFLPWLAANRPELGITAATTWDAMPGTWVLIVSHYLYFSSDWELDLAWHVMVAPDDWSRINLRRRWTELQPSLAFEISSVSGATTPHEIAPEAAVWR